MNNLERSRREGAKRRSAISEPARRGRGEEPHEHEARHEAAHVGHERHPAGLLGLAIAPRPLTSWITIQRPSITNAGTVGHARRATSTRTRFCGNSSM